MEVALPREFFSQLRLIRFVPYVRPSGKFGYRDVARIRTGACIDACCRIGGETDGWRLKLGPPR